MADPSPCMRADNVICKGQRAEQDGQRMRARKDRTIVFEWMKLDRSNDHEPHQQHTSSAVLPETWTLPHISV